MKVTNAAIHIKLHAYLHTYIFLLYHTINDSFHGCLFSCGKGEDEVYQRWPRMDGMVHVGSK